MKTSSKSQKKETKTDSYHTFKIGNDLTVNRLGFGAMQLCGKGVWGNPPDRKRAIKLLHRVLESDINFIDTADSYGPEIAETLIAEALYPYPDHLLIATKGGLVRPGPGQWTINGDPKHLRAACEGSLKRLKLDRIDLYQLHRIDPQIPLQDQIGVLKDLQKEGKIRHIGLSEVNIIQIEEVRKMIPVVSVQNRYNLQDRASEKVLDYCTREQIAFIPWYPLATGNLAQPGGVLERLSKKLQAKPAQIALAWLLKKSPVMLPIPGTSSLRHLKENTSARLLELSDMTMKKLES